MMHDSNIPMTIESPLEAVGDACLFRLIDFSIDPETQWLVLDFTTNTLGQQADADGTE